MRQKFFVSPWAVAGDVTEPPNAVDPNNLVSYTAGFTSLYSLDRSTDPTAQAVPRATMNAVLNDITTSLAALQQTGVPEWIDTTDNEGIPFEYGIGSRVLYSTAGTPPFTVYVSTVSNNTSVPGTDTNWQVALDFESSAAAILTGTDDTTTVTPRRLAAAGVRFGTTVPIVASSTLTTADLGAFIRVGANGTTQTLPPIANCPVGTGYFITAAYPSAGTSTTIQANGAELIASPNAATSNTFVIKAGESAWLVNNGETWDVATHIAAPTVQSSGGMPGDRTHFTASITNAGFTQVTAVWESFTVYDPTANITYRIPAGNSIFTLGLAAGIGSLDGGTAVYVDCPIVIYMMYNPATQAVGLMGQVEVSGATAPLPSTYQGGHAPAGYTASGIAFAICADNTAAKLLSMRVQGRTTTIVAQSTTISPPSGSSLANTRVKFLPASAVEILITAGLTESDVGSSLFQIGTLVDPAGSESLIGLGITLEASLNNTASGSSGVININVPGTIGYLIVSSGTDDAFLYYNCGWTV